MVLEKNPHQFITAARGRHVQVRQHAALQRSALGLVGMLWVFIRLKQPAACFVPFLCSICPFTRARARARPASGFGFSLSLSLFPAGLDVNCEGQQDGSSPEVSLDPEPRIPI